MKEHYLIHLPSILDPILFGEEGVEAWVERCQREDLPGMHMGRW